MRILYHHRTASKDGQAVHIEELVASLRELGHEVEVVGPTPATGSMGTEVGWIHGLRKRLPKAFYELLELGYSLVAYIRLAQAVRRFKPDVIYERYNLFMLAGVMLARRRRIPLLLEVNAPLADERSRFGGLALPAMAHWAEDYAWRRADVVLPVTQVLARMIEARGVEACRLVVIPNGINDSSFANAPSTEEAKRAIGWGGALVLGFTGFVRDWHGVDRVIRWLATSDAPAASRLLVVGDGPARPALEALAGSLGLGHRVRFTGVVERDQVPRLVSAFDIALQPAAVAYASPLKLAEYLALGRAIVAPRQPNLEEVLTHGSNAILFEPDRAGALEAALTRLCTDTALRESLAYDARDSIARLGLTWRHNAQRVAVLALKCTGEEIRNACASANP